MPTESEAAARHEAEVLGAIDWSITESAVIPQVDPRDDLARRGAEWRYRFADADLGELARFAAGLAAAEADAWAAGDGSVATKAYADRRFFIADRVVAWAVPWLDARSRCYLADRERAERDRDAWLAIADAHRSSPALVGSDFPGEDSYGPMEFGDLADRLESLWGGMVLFDVTAQSVLGRPGAVVSDLAQRRDELQHLYAAAAARWRRLADAHPGSGRMWLDLAARSDITAHLTQQRGSRATGTS